MDREGNSLTSKERDIEIRKNWEKKRTIGTLDYGYDHLIMHDNE